MTASKLLGIMCYKAHNFMNASIPSYRLNIHLARLVEEGLKVAVVQQTETSALKQQKGTFKRELSGTPSHCEVLKTIVRVRLGLGLCSCSFRVSVSATRLCHRAVVLCNRKPQYMFSHHIASYPSASLFLSLSVTHIEYL